MAAIKPEDWGRIYAFIWKDARSGTGTFKPLFETDPNRTIKEIARILKLLPDGVDIGDYDRLFEVDVPPPH